ncbi:MAG TPA: hypothetical protein VL175_10665 [Pirellulales bacterium]|jgi:hypothetical protein|nr:hypothetical protein [Pirellulales bacterium]
MPATYDKMGIHFLYPDNWSLDEGDALDGVPSVSVYSPGGAFWSIALHPRETEPSEVAAAALQALQAEYDEAEAEPVDEQIGPESISGYDLNFFYLDFTNTALIRGFRTPAATCLVLCQAEDREFARIGAVFRAITTSLLARTENS